MFIRVLSRGLFFRRESQVDFTGTPLGDRKINVEDVKVVHSLADNVVDALSLDDESHNEPETSPLKPAKAVHTEGHDVEDHPVLPGTVPGGAHQALDFLSNVHKSSHASSESDASYVFGDTTGVAVSAEDDAEEADEIFQTPLHQTPFLAHPEDGTSTKQRFIEHFDDAVCPSKTPSPDAPPDMPAMESRPTQSMLSDITEADESGPQDLSMRESKLSSNLLRVRTLSFSSFGSSYPSSCFGSPSPNNPPNGMTTTCSITLCPEAPISVSSPADDGLTQSTAQLASHEVADPGQRPSTTASSTSDFVPFIVEPLLSSSSIDQLGEEEVLDNDEHKDAHEARPEPMPTSMTGVIPSASTYADATNLALQHPELASDILRRPLSSASPSKFPTPSVSCSVSLQVVPPASASCTPIRAGTPHTAERPNWALAPDVVAPGRPGSAATPKEHTSENPNWAFAKNEAKSPASRRSRSRSRAQGRGGTRPPSTTRGAEQWTCRVSLIPDTDQAEPATQTVPTSAIVSPKQKVECYNALPVPSEAANLEDGPQQWLNRVNTWVEQTSRGPKTCPGTPDPDADAKCASTSPSTPKEPSIQPQRHSRTTSGLNPHAPVWTPAPRARCQTPSDSDSAPPPTQSESSPSTSSVRGPFTFGVDADIDRLRDMLRNCGIQDKEATVASFSSGDTTTSGSAGSTPPGPEETECVPSSDEDSQKTTGTYGKTREVNKTPGRVDPQGTARPHPQVNLPQQGFEFTAPTRLGPPFSLAGPMSGRGSSFPQNLFATPPRFAFLRANAQHFRKESDGPWISGRFDPVTNVSSSGPSGFSHPSSGPSSFSFSGSAPGPSRLSFSQASHSFSRTCQPDPGSSNMQGSPSPFLPGSYTVRVNCIEKGREVPAPVSAPAPLPLPALPDAPISPLAAGVKRPRQPTIGPSTFKSQRFA
ncbi:hypothetical protein GSI_00998 [Ganoderma sinense ZZ0214-1]|uniref:Uncharacterized protein n=1 Tax=Ganoderma sinense ZZ0214-1 TaxID=1077348 RepID=A0A2G8SU58_9APHY|nr:hypothetical protein GSI_00998 [Ganoderma sinense ZZ0214-1]